MKRIIHLCLATLFGWCFVVACGALPDPGDHVETVFLDFYFFGANLPPVVVGLILVGAALAVMNSLALIISPSFWTV
jgi:hypothetical protein